MPEKAFWKYEIKYLKKSILKIQNKILFWKYFLQKYILKIVFVFFNYTYYVGVRSPDTYICAWGQQVDSSGVPCPFNALCGCALYNFRYANQYWYRYWIGNWYIKNWRNVWQTVTRERRNESGLRENILCKVFWEKYFGKSILNLRK